MAKLHFYYSAMNAGKSTILIQSSHNYEERGMQTLIYSPLVDTRAGRNMVASRIGIEKTAKSVSENMNIFEDVRSVVKASERLGCVLVDEAQFLTKAHVHQLCQICDVLDLPVLAYGLRSDFQGEPFVGSQYLLALADQIIEIKTIVLW